MKFRIQTTTKSIQIPFSEDIQIFDPLFMEIYFSCQSGVARSFQAKFHQILKLQEFLVNF
jgi:hypothetical protein